MRARNQVLCDWAQNKACLMFLIRYLYSSRIPVCGSSLSLSPSLMQFVFRTFFFISLLLASVWPIFGEFFFLFLLLLLPFAFASCRSLGAVFVWVVAIRMSSVANEVMRIEYEIGQKSNFPWPLIHKHTHKERNRHGFCSHKQQNSLQSFAQTFAWNWLEIGFLFAINVWWLNFKRKLTNQMDEPNRLESIAHFYVH